MIALVDCNNFFASCERLFRPDLKEIPVLVLSNNDGCVVARSEEVKALGIPMAVPYFKIRDIVKRNNVQCFSSNFGLYSNISQRILGVLSEHAPQIEVYSIDEAFMELSELPAQDFKKWGDRLRAEILTNIGMPVSVGIAPTKTLAKLASAYAKKHQQTCVIDPESSPREYQKILSDFPIEAVWGIGRRLAPRMFAAGIHTAWQLSQVSEQWMHSQLGITGTRMHSELRGSVMYPFEESSPPQKTLMASRSFGHTVKNTHDLETAVASFASQAAYRLRSFEQVTGYFGVYLRFKTKDGVVKGQSIGTSLAVPTNDTSQLVQTALELMYRLYDEEHGYKKSGVFANHLTSANVCQVDLFDTLTPEMKTRRQSFMQAIDDINHRYGKDTIHISSIDPKSKRWHALKKRMSPAYVTDWNQLPLLHPVKTSPAVSS
jgi:DNA polymerase V